MAARENQGYLIAVIVLVLLSLVLALAAFLGISKMNEYYDNRIAVESEMKLAEKRSQANEIQAEILKAWIGDLGPSVAEVETQIDSLRRLATSNELEPAQRSQIEKIVTAVEEAKAIFEKDMRANGASTEVGQAQDLTYRKLISGISNVLAKKHNELNIKVQEAALAEQDAQTKIAAKQTEVTQLQSSKETLENDIQKLKAESAAKQKELTASLDQSLEEIKSVNAKLEELKLKTDGEKRELQNQVTTTDGQNKNLKNKINIYEKEVFDRPDGEITKVAANIQAVYINLGILDGLTVNRSFSVFDRSVTNFESGQHKATVEVVRVSDNQAEARITTEDPTNPILPGDYVLTATWDPGHPVPMALSGYFDMDGDGSSDTEKLIQMIKKNGGVVVAWHDDEGNIQGEINETVRYLVEGESPETGPGANTNVVRAMNTLRDQAESNTVQIIDLQKLLSRMGVRGKPKIESIDRKTGGFQSRTPADSLKASDR